MYVWRGEWIFQVCTMEEATENIWISMLNPFTPDKHIKEVLKLKTSILTCWIYRK